MNILKHNAKSLVYQCCIAATENSANIRFGPYAARKQVMACIVRSPAAEAISNGRYYIPAIFKQYSWKHLAWLSPAKVVAWQKERAKA